MEGFGLKFRLPAVKKLPAFSPLKKRTPKSPSSYPKSTAWDHWGSTPGERHCTVWNSQKSNGRPPAVSSGYPNRLAFHRPI